MVVHKSIKKKVLEGGVIEITARIGICMLPAEFPGSCWPTTSFLTCHNYLLAPPGTNMATPLYSADEDEIFSTGS